MKTTIVFFTKSIKFKKKISSHILFIFGIKASIFKNQHKLLKSIPPFNQPVIIWAEKQYNKRVRSAISESFPSFLSLKKEGRFLPFAKVAPSYWLTKNSGSVAQRNIIHGFNTSYSPNILSLKKLENLGQICTFAHYIIISFSKKEINGQYQITPSRP